MMLLYSITLYPGFTFLDFITYPAHALQLVGLRALMVALSLAALAAIPRLAIHWQRRWAVLHGIIAGSLIALMCGLTEGFASIYLVGVMLCMQGLTTLTLYAPREFLCIIVVVTLAYVLCCGLMHEISEAKHIWEALFFLLSAETFCMVCVFVMEYQRRRLFDATQTLVAQTQELQSALATQGEFLRTVSHEFRTPISAVIGFADLLAEQETLTTAGTRRLGRIRQSASRLLLLVNDILDLSKIAAGRLDIQVEEFNLRDLLETVAESTSVLIGRREVDVRVECCSNLTLYSDSDRVEQIVMNLASNAAKFTERGHILLAAHPHGDMLKILVEDTGIGIPHEAQAHIFNAFKQAHTRSHIVGTGLGLSIVKQLCARLGGYIEFDSEPGHGSSFRIFLPKRIQE